MKIRSIFLLILVIIVIPLTFASDTQHRFKIHVVVTPIDSAKVSESELSLETFVKRELRALGDVDIVGADEDWIFLISFVITEINFEDGTKTGYLSIARSVSTVVSKDNFKEYKYTGHFRPVYPPSLSAAYWPSNDLHRLAIEWAGQFDKRLESTRALLRSLSK